MTFQPVVSVIINTDARLDSLKRTLDSLRWLDYPAFEVCAVYGPTADGTKELLEARHAEIKLAHCPTRNLSLSRNVGIAMAAGEIVAFLDDDSIPEPEWLTKITPAFEQQDVGACGGFLHDNTGVGYQWRFGTVDRLGVPDESWERPPIEFNFPFTAKFAHVMANSAFRKSAIEAIGGFDEQYKYYLDETDLICRLVDAGWRIVPMAGAAVHHKFLPSHIRNRGVFSGWYQLVKSKIYFSLVNSHGHHGLSEAVKSAFTFVERFRANLEWGITEGRASEADRSRFAAEVDLGLQDGLQIGLAKARRLPSEKELQHFARPFLAFPTLMAAGERRTLCLLTKTYPPASIGGIGRHIHNLSRAIARLGHQVHVLTRSAEHDSVDFEEGVWVHRLCPKPQPRRVIADICVPEHIWNHSATMLAEARRIAESRKVDTVIAPIWDCEGIAFLVDGTFKLVTGLYTTFQQWLQTTGNRPYDKAFMADFIQPMLALEKLLFDQSDGILADSRAIIGDIEDAYKVNFDAARLGLVLLGLDDWSHEAAIGPQPLPGAALRVLFVGRLEERKGIDVLLQAAKTVLSDHSQVHFDIVGDDRLPGPNDLTYRAVFEADRDADAVRDRVHFHGEVSEPQLRGFYQACDIFVAPSRFESFGLILLEAMMFGKPVIGCRAGGMTEIIEQGVSGLLAEPGDVGSLISCLQQLLSDAQRRARLGEEGRRRYLASFTAESMARGTLEFVSRLPEKVTPGVQGAVEHTVSGGSKIAPVARSVRRSRYRIALVNSILARNDAISASVRSMFYMLSGDPAFDVSVFAARSDYSELPCRIVQDSAQLLLDAEYRNADLIIWHFGICYEFFNALLVGNGRARQVVVFHNVTPKAYVTDALAPLIDQSLAQRHNMRSADEVWNVSELNAEAAREVGIQGERALVIPLCVEAPPRGNLIDKDCEEINILFVGRFVKSKGVLDLVEAIARLPREELRPFHVTLAGNQEFSDPLYLEEVKRQIAALNLSNDVCVLGTIDEAALERLYSRSHILAIPSYHEGFCKPVIEALRSGCIPVGYDNSNLPAVSAGHGRMVTTGNVDALAVALTQLLRELPEALRHPTQRRVTLDRGPRTVAEFDSSAQDYVERFTPERVCRQLRGRVYALLGLDAQGSDRMESDRRAMVH